MNIHPDVWNNIVPYLDLSTLVTVFQVSTIYHKLSNTSLHWKERIKNEIPKSQINFETCTTKEDYISLYQNLSILKYKKLTFFSTKFSLKMVNFWNFSRSTARYNL